MQDILFKDKYLLYCIESVNYIYQQISYTCMLNTISFFNVLCFVYFLHFLLLQNGDIERNSGPQRGQSKNLSCCHWNVNSLVVQTLSKITQLEAYNFLYKHDFIYISETYFDSSILEGDSSFQLHGYRLITADHPSNTKKEVFVFTIKNHKKIVHKRVSIFSETLRNIFPNFIR